MAKLQNNVPDLLVNAMEGAGIKYTIAKGTIYYHSVDDYKAGQKAIKSLEKQLPQQGYNKFGNKKVKLVLPNGNIEDNPFYTVDLVTFDSEDEEIIISA